MNNSHPVVSILAIAVCMSTGLRAESPSPADRPNVVIIMTDDQGYGDTGFTGNPVIRTPNLDAMARRSAWMKRFYVSPVCAPTRACLMTGRYNYRTRAIDTFVGRAMMEPDEVTLAEVLRDAGYATGIFGKWHLGDNYPMRPMDQGFTESLVHRGGGIGQPADPPEGENKYTDAVLFHNGERVRTSGYCTDVYFESAMDWIEKTHQQGNRFFAYIPTNAPHFPVHDVPADALARYRDADLVSVMLNKPDPDSLRNSVDTLARVFAMITNIDENVGRLFERLDRLDLTDNTLVIFLTDNGPNTRRYVGPLRGMKGEVHEGGVRTTFFAHWPARLKAGHTNDIPAAHIDVMPTVLDACGIDTPADVKLDGRSILPLLEDRTESFPERTLFIQSHRGDVPVLYHHFCAVGPRWKLLNPSGFGREKLPAPPEFELYDLIADPGERHNLANEHPDVVNRLKRDYETWFEDVGSTRPDNYAPPRIHVGTPHEDPTVLTRQDWRHQSGRPWGPKSNGVWLLHVAEPGPYDITLRFEPEDEAGTATVTAGDESVSQPIGSHAQTCEFTNVNLPTGDVELRAELKHGDQSKGAWHVVISKR